MPFSIHTLAGSLMKLREFLELHKKDFEITGGGIIQTFQGKEVEHPGKVIRLNFESYIQDVLTECKAYIKKALSLKKVPMSSGLAFTNEYCPINPEQQKQKYYRSFIAKHQFAASCICFDTSFAVSTLACFCAPAAAQPGRSIALGGTASSDGVPRGIPKPQAHLPSAHWLLARSISLKR